MGPDYYLKIKNKLPSLSGIYIFRDRNKKPLYIGKAKNLTNRVKSYFYGSKVPMIAKMLEQANSLTWHETLSEIEALILESQHIKKYRPPFNTLLRDDKQYFYVGLTREQFPHLFVTHQPEKLQLKNRGLKMEFIGPFTDGSALKLALKNLRVIFPYCTCKQAHLNYCLNYHIGNCPGYCCLKNPQLSRPRITGYRKNIKNIRDILNGKKKAVITRLINRLREEENLEDLENFENISRLRTRISKLQKFFLNTKIINNTNESHKLLLDIRKCLLLTDLPVRIEGYDISNISGLFATGAMVTFINGQSDKNEYRKFKIRSIASSSLPDQLAGDTGMLRGIIERRFKHKEWQFPDLILVDGGKGQVNSATSVLKKMSINIPVAGIIKNEKHFGERLLLGKQNKIINLETLPTAVKNLLLQIDSEAHRFAIQYYRKRHSLF